MEPCQVKASYPQKNQGNTKGNEQPVWYSELVFVEEVYRYLQGEKGIEKTRALPVTGDKKQENERKYNPDDNKDYACFFSVVHIFRFPYVTKTPVVPTGVFVYYPFRVYLLAAFLKFFFHCFLCRLYIDVS